MAKVSASDKVSNGLAWAAEIAAALGGICAVGTFLGDWTNTVLEWLPERWTLYVTIGLVVLMLGRVVFDLADDHVPDKLSTIYLTLLWPSVVMSLTGDVGDWFDTGIGAVHKWLADHAASAFIDNPGKGDGEAILTCFAIAFFVFALVWGHRYHSKNRGAVAGGRTSATIPVTSTTSTRNTRR